MGQALRDVLMRSLRAVVCGFLVTASLVHVMPGGTFVALFVGGFVVGLFAKEMREHGFALPAALLVGTAAWFNAAVPLPAMTLFVGWPFAALAGSGISFVFRQALKREHLAYGVAALLLLAFFAQSVPAARPVAQMAATEPQAEQYGFDPIFFLKVFYLQDQGQSFNEAYDNGYRQDARFDAPFPDVSAWRSPLLTGLWAALFDSGAPIVWSFVFLSLAALGALYFIAMKVSDETSALVAPALAFPYYHVALRTPWLFEYEYWAGFAIIASAVLVLVKRRWEGLGFAVLGVALREWLISGVVAGAVDRLAKKEWRRALPWIGGVVFGVAFYIVKSMLVRDHLASVGVEPSVAWGRIGSGGPAFVLYTLQFGNQLYAHPYVVPYAAFFLALAGAGWLIHKRHYHLPMLLLVPLLAFMFVGSGQKPGGPAGWDDYYNAAFMPFAFALAASAVGVGQRLDEPSAVGFRAGSSKKSPGKKGASRKPKRRVA